MPRTSVASLVWVAATATVLAAPAPKPGELGVSLPGEWVAVEAEEKGRKQSANSVAHELFRAIFAKQELTLRRSREDVVRSRFQYSVTTRAGKLIDLDLRIEDGQTNHALLRIDDADTITIVIHNRFKANRPADRPTSITSERNKEKGPEGEWNPLLFKFRRVPKAQTAADALKAEVRP